MDSMDTLAEGTPWLYHPILLVTALDGQSIRGYHGYFDRGYPLVLSANTIYFTVSMDTEDALTTWLNQPMLLCTSLDGQSICGYFDRIHSYHGYFDRGCPLVLPANTTLYILG